MADLTDFDTPPIILMEDAGFVLLEDWQVGWYIPWVGESVSVVSGSITAQLASLVSGGTGKIFISGRPTAQLPSLVSSLVSNLKVTGVMNVQLSPLTASLTQLFERIATIQAVLGVTTGGGGSSGFPILGG